MAYATTDDGVRLCYEDTGAGVPIVFVHEFAGDHRSWEPQVRFFSRRHRCIAYAARGYPPSDVPERVDSYSQKRAAADIRGGDGRRRDRAGARGRPVDGRLRHAALRARPTPSGRCRWSRPASATAPRRTAKPQFRQGAEEAARGFESKGSRAFAEIYGVAAARVQFEAKDPRGWREFVDQLAEHSPLGAANTMRGVQAQAAVLVRSRGPSSNGSPCRP